MTDFTPEKAPAKVTRKPIRREHNGQAIRENTGRRTNGASRPVSAQTEEKPAKNTWRRRY